MTTKTKPARLYPGPAYESAESPTGWYTDQFDLNVPSEYNAWEAAWAEHLGQKAPTPIANTASKRGIPAADEKSDAEKQAFGEALTYIREYRGTWAFILDLRSDPKWNTKWFRLSDRQIEVILNAKARDAQRAAEAPTSSHPRYAEAVEFAKANAAGNDFLASIAEQSTRRTLSDRQVDAVLRNVDRDKPAPRENGGPSFVVTEGWYMVGETPWKAQLAVNQSGHLYGKRLDVLDGKGSWTYVPGGLKTIATQGRPMTVEEARGYGKLYGICACCGRTLTDETSIANGLGPICEGRLG